MPRPVSPVQKGPSRGEFLIPHPREVEIDDETGEAERQSAAAFMSSFLNDGRSTTAVTEDMGGSDLSALLNLVHDIKTMVVVDLETVLKDAREQFRQHNALLSSQASLTEKILHQVLHNGSVVSRENSRTPEQMVLQHDKKIRETPVVTFGQPMSPAELDDSEETRLTRSDPSPNGIPPSKNSKYITEPRKESPPLDFPDSNDSVDVILNLSPKLTCNSNSYASSLFEHEESEATNVPKGHQRKSEFCNVPARASTELEIERRNTPLTVNTYRDADLSMPDYRVEQRYFDKGVCQAIAKSEYFQHLTLGVILANAIYIGVDADRNRAKSISEADVPFQVFEYSFFCFFAFEWCMRLGAFRHKFDCLRDLWFKFDTALVTLMVVESFLLPLILSGLAIPIPTSMIKLVRLLRIARMARLMRALPELVAMIKGVRMAFRAVGSALLLLVILVYVFAIVIFVLLRDDVEVMNDEFGTLTLTTYFGTLSLTMWTLLVDGAFMDSYGIVSRKLIQNGQWLPFAVFMFFVLASALTVMNMLIGVLCEVVTGVAAAEKEEFDVRLVKDSLLVMLLQLDFDGNGELDKDEMSRVLQDRSSLQVLRSIEVEPTYLMDHVEMFFEGSDGNLPIAHIMDLILMLRGNRTPTMRDILHVQDYQRWKLRSYLHQQGKFIEKKFERVYNMIPSPVRLV